MLKRSTVVGVLLAMSSLVLAASAGARTKVVYAGGPAKWAASLGKQTGAGVDNFLINRVTINVGDTVDWNGTDLAAGFHTVDIPKLNGSDLALITATGKTVQGVNDAAGNPFWFNGKVPVLSFNTALFGASGPRAYNGTTRVDSGLPVGPPHDFKVKFLTPGTYKYFCDVHHGMDGEVIVKPKGAVVPSAQQDAATLRSEEQGYAAEAQRIDRTKVQKNRVSVGASGPGGLEVFAMFPGVLRIKAGTTVQFMMSKDSREVHTATFGPRSYVQPLGRSFTSPAPSPAALYPSDPPGHIVLSSGSHGNGFANTGLMDRDATTPLPALGAITFTQAGTYRYVCLVHPFMRGTIIVK